MMNAADATSSLCLYYSKPRAFLVLLGLSALALWFAYLILAGVVAGHLVILIAGAAAGLALAPVLAPMFIETLVALKSNEVVVILDERGITDSRKQEPFLGWDEISKIALGSTQKSRSYLIIDFRNSVVARSKEQSGFTFWIRRFASFGDWQVNLRPLRRKDEEVLRKAQRLHQEFIRREVVRKSGPATMGWSGSL
jgi:hypothetical protein